MKFRTQRVRKNDKVYVFVTRTRSKAMTKQEIRSFFKENGIEGPKEKPVENKLDTGWQVPDDRQRQRMFLNDLKLGLAFCAKKYNVTEDQVVAEAKRVAPHFNTGVLK